MVKYAFILASFLFTFSLLSQENHKVVEVTRYGDSNTIYFVPDEQLIDERWDLLAQPNFWKKVMVLSPDSCIINVAETRQILYYTSFIDWKAQTEEEKDSVRMQIRMDYGLDSNERLYVTSGKNHFYQVEKVLPSLSKGIEVFEREGVNPWYAQTILLIESPGKIAYSNVGAFGPFQLMKSVARNHGLRVDKYVDERKDFDKSAYGSAHLLRTSCIPEAKRIMTKFGIHIKGTKEHELWFRLLVLHVYHAGAGNVNKVLVNVVKPNCGCKDVITTIWQSKYGNFGNSSQNYSQLALASNFVLEEFIKTKCSAVE